ncbi:hypothetical protein LZM41_26465, partial [Pseudomonas aeruginosa]|nr:hypothetical protein [Pseudomonas aeruginosa]
MTMTFQHDDLPLALYSAAQVRDLDARLIAAGTPGFELMQRAWVVQMVRQVGNYGEIFARNVGDGSP